MSADDFVHRKNIERYRQMLQAGSLAEEDRRKIASLLAEEEGKDAINDLRATSLTHSRLPPSEKS